MTLFAVLIIGGLLSLSRHLNPDPGFKPSAANGFYDPKLTAHQRDSIKAAEDALLAQALAVDTTVGDVVPDRSPTTRQNSEELIKKQFSSWSGAHRNLEKLIKKNMHDPSSYEHEETSYLDKGDYLLVTTKFRGTNAYGGKVLNSVTAKVDFSGNVLEVVE
ncbi:hypothetical protein GCM10027189_23340 [Rufibacter soli]